MNRVSRRISERSAAAQPFLVRTAASALVAIIVMVVLLLASMTAARAHAYIVSTQPAANGSYERPGGSVAISFDEPVDILDANAIFVTDNHGKRVDAHDASIDPNDATRVIVHVPKDLARGVYTVHWRVVSADTHVVHGIYQIGVGVAVTSGETADQGSAFDPSAPLASVLRGLSLLGALAICGSLLLRSAVLRRLDAAYGGLMPPARIVVIAGAALVLVAAVPSLLVQSAAASGAMGSGVAATLTHTLWGRAFLIRVALAITLLALGLRGGKLLGAWSFIASAALLATFSATSHALTQKDALGRAIAESADLLHLLAAAIWIGGILTLGAALYTFHRSKNERTGEIARSLFAQFTPIACVCVTVVVLTGIYAALIHLGAVSDLYTTTYGRLLLAKIALVVIVLGLGYAHLRAGLRAASVRSLRSFALEIVVGIVVIFVTAFLIGQMPPMRMPGMPGMPGMPALILNETEF